MLLKDFYTVKSLKNEEGTKYLAHIFINEKHEIFNGHFPGNPIMPGVCMMQIIKELAEQISGKTLLMERLSNVKFMALINPEQTPDLRLELEISTSDEHQIKLKNTTYFNDTVALKLSSVYKIVS